MNTRFLKTSIQNTLAILVALVLLQGCLGMSVKPKEATKVIPALKLTADSGYLSKSEVIPFLTGNALTDTLNIWWKGWKATDTMGKYYRLNNNNGYMVCVLCADNTHDVAANKLIELDKNGMLVSTADFFCDWCNINRRTQALNKRGKYFITYSCGHGALFSSSWFTLFTSIADRGAQIMESQHMGAPKCQSIYSNWKLWGDSCLVNYTVENSKSTENGCEPADVQKVSVLYHLHNGKWAATDSSRITSMRIAQ